MMRLLTVGLMTGLMLAACAAPQNNLTTEAGEEVTQRRLPTDAEVEQYNAQVEPKDRIVCRDEVTVGSNIPQRKCRLIMDIDETSLFHRDQLRRALR